MSDMLGISSNGIGAYQRALSTVANNISNVNTEGYSRQDVVLKDSAPKKMAGMYMGTGVMLTNIKRQFDAFAESNLRNSTSDLASQKPMVDYAKRVMDIMGDKSIGLSSAFDQFFASASALSADPASTVQRTSFLRSADGVASRFGELNSQLDLIATETSEGIKSVAAQVNTLTGQLALINQSLTKSPTLESQPAELLDRRDLTLRQLSDLVRTKVSFTTNGTVNVSLGTTMTQGLVVNGNKARPIGVDTSVAGKIELVLDPYGKTESLASASGGQLGGYQSFISQVLDPAQKNLSALAQTFVAEANTIQKNGIDGYGQMGADLFAFEPKVSSPAAGIRLAMNDGMRVATAAQFRVSENTANITTTRATVKFTGTTPATQLSNAQLVNNPNKTAGVTFKVDGARVYTPVTTLSAGVGATFYLDEAESGQQLQVMTRDGRQLLGAALTETEKFQLFKPENGFAANANYSDVYLNKSGEYAYRGLDMFYGAKATVLYGQNFDQFGQAGNPLPLNAALETGRIDTADFAVAQGAIQVNGVALSEFKASNTTEAMLTGIKLPANASTVFNFRAVVNGDLKNGTFTLDAGSDLASLRSRLETIINQTIPGAEVSLINQNQDLRITDDKGREINGLSLTSSNEATVVANFGDTGTVDFKSFKLSVGSQNLSLSDLTATDMEGLAQELNTRLRQLDEASGLSVSVVGGNLKITDTMGRALKNLSLSLSDTASVGASVDSQTINNSTALVGHVEVTSATSKVAAWVNGISEATIGGPSINSGFEKLKATLGGVSFDVAFDGSNPAQSLQELAAQIQAAMRKQDGGSSDISVNIENGDQVRIRDAAGREFKNFALIPRPISDTVPGDAIPGTVTIANSVMSQSHVRAEVFSQLRVPVAHLQLGKPLVLNGQPITNFDTAETLVKAINKSAAGLTASIGTDGLLIIENPQGTSIRVGSTPEGNALNAQPGTYNAQVRMVQVARDMRVGSADIDLKKPLSINGVNFSEATYQLPSINSSEQYSIEFGYPSKSVSADTSEALVAAMNSSASISSIQWPPAGQTMRMEVMVDGEVHTFEWVPPDALDPSDKLAEFAVAISSQLAEQDIKVSAQAGGLVFSNTKGINLTPLSLESVDKSSDPEVSKTAGFVDTKFSAAYYATVKDGQFVIGAIKGDIAEADLKNTFVIKADDQEVVARPSVKNLNELIARINVECKTTGVVASIDINGDLKLSTTDPKGLRDISIGPGVNADGQYAANALGLTPSDYGVAYRLQQLLQDDTQLHDVRISFGSYVENTPGFPPVTKFGDPADLAKLGLRTGAYIEGGCPDDLLLFVTGKGSANVAVGFEGQPDNVRDSLRSQSLTLKFTAEDRYNIIDVKTGTVLADRHYDPSVLEPVVEFNGLQIKLSHAPAVGDSYKVDGNFDGLGNNVNMLDMVDLNKKPTVNGKTLANTYIDQINNVGNLAQQAIITQQALTVVNDQAIAARDKVSGVNLDEEAAALIRYQQAYQACAKALQVSGELFDSIIQIR